MLSSYHYIHAGPDIAMPLTNQDIFIVVPVLGTVAIIVTIGLLGLFIIIWHRKVCKSNNVTGTQTVTANRGAH